MGRTVLTHAPLNPRSLWLVGTSMEIQGKTGDARRAMQQAERISRRDSAVQMWLGSDNLRRGDIVGGLRHFDLMIRANGEAADLVIPRMALIIPLAEGRRHLAPYIRDDNPWMLRLFQTAITQLPRAAPIAELLVERRKNAPNVGDIRSVYGPLMARLVNEGSYAIALRLYPLLPDADSASLRNVSGAINGKIDEGYPPFVWNFPNDNAQGAEFVSLENGETGLDVFGAPGTIGIAATKIVAARAGDTLYWQIADRMGNLESSANWIATCLAGKSVGRATRSSNMLDSSTPQKRILKIMLPVDCGLVRLDMRVAGGIGRDPVNLVIGSMKLAPGSKAQ
ncbi:hypothetical protein [Sphingobium boeckii]|uniref:Uncharacterized protein n=1 Tax=Sphingobium boeckii TaxID=1082345 RepID=A0A7W9EDY4_9SPHN|nr:hypothetical protein [Sphingobium boeckii]MBB5685743.1 hypothetical protein [Sphingobium boeckii]